MSKLEAESAVEHLSHVSDYMAEGWKDDHLEIMSGVTQQLRDGLATELVDVNALVNHILTIANAIHSLSEEQRGEKHLFVCRRFVQVLANYSVAINALNGKTEPTLESPIWGQLKVKPEFWVRLLSHKDEKLKTYSSMLLYNCTHYCNASLSELIDRPTLYSTLILSVIGSLKLETSPEWNVYLLEKLLSHANLVGAYRNTLTPENMHILLDVIGHVLDKNGHIFEDNLICISNTFSEMHMFLGDIAKTVYNAPASETWQILRKCLCILSKCTCCVQYPSVRGHHTLFITATQFLTEIVSLGKKDHLLFRPKLDLEAFRKLFHNETVGVCPSIVYGLKQDLVRVIGNMAEANESMQCLVEQYNVLPLLLDCTVSESENPLLSQWAVLAIRHLCQVESNRNIIANLQPLSQLQSPVPEIHQLLQSLNIKKE